MSSLAHAAAGNGFDSKEPIEISSDSLEVLQKDKIAIFRGNVIAKQGKVTLNANEMKVFYKENGSDSGSSGNSVSRIEVAGKVLMVTAQESAEADKGVYKVDQKHVTLLGNVSLTKDKSIIKGNRLEYDLAAGKSVLTSLPAEGTGKKGSRVRGVFVPEQKK
ncbi:MAG: lipopolysaccharide transport periplasmic protein LptA [Rickettsiales bacterium]